MGRQRHPCALVPMRGDRGVQSERHSVPSQQRRMVRAELREAARRGPEHGVPVGAGAQGAQPGPLPTLPIEPMQASILTVIDQAAITKKKAEEIEIFMTLDGPLRGLYALLQLYYGRAEQPKQPKRGEPEVCPEVASAASARGRHALPAHDEDLVTGEDDDG